MGSRQRTIGVSCILIAMIVALFAGTAVAEDTAAAAAVKAVVERGVIMAIVEGQDAALAAIGNPDGPFIDGDLYLFAGLVSEVIMTAHPYSSLVGQDLTDYEDPQGNLLFANFVVVASDAGAGWSEYWWPKPGEDDPSRKLTYIMKVAGQDLYIGCGYYPED
jgi:cytochrome c